MAILGVLKCKAEKDSKGKLLLAFVASAIRAETTVKIKAKGNLSAPCVHYSRAEIEIPAADGKGTVTCMAALTITTDLAGAKRLGTVVRAESDQAASPVTVRRMTADEARAAGLIK